MIREVSGNWEDTGKGKRYFYRLTFTADEVRALHFLGPRGYCGASELLGHTDEATGECVLAESAAWEWRESATDDGERSATGETWPYFTCAGETLAHKLHALWEAIV